MPRRTWMSESGRCSGAAEGVERQDRPAHDVSGSLYCRVCYREIIVKTITKGIMSKNFDGIRLHAMFSGKLQHAV